MSILIEKLSYVHQAGSPFAQEALRHVSFVVQAGEILGIMGKTGCGKTTLLQLMAGLLPGRPGSVFVDGEDIYAPSYDKAKLRQRLGLLFQYPEYQLFESTVAKDVAFGIKYMPLTREEKAERVKEALRLCGFVPEKVLSLSPHSLSGGQKRRVAMAGVLAVQPRYLLLDEPFAGLDPLGRRELTALLNQLRQRGVGVVIVSHSMDCLAECAQRLILLEQGELRLDGSLEYAFSQPELLHSLGLERSTSREIAHLLQAQGMLEEKGILCYADLLSAIAQHMRRTKDVE